MYVDGIVLLVLYILGAGSFLLAVYLLFELRENQQETQRKIKALENRPPQIENYNPWKKK